MKKTILQTLVGSRAHGLHTEESDYDYRGVFVESTSDMLSIGYKSHPTSWLEGKEDQTSYEIGHFLNLACKSNPSILEVLVAPVQEVTWEGEELRALFPYVWNSTDVYNAFLGYSKNQQKKFMDDKDGRTHKYAVAYIRVLIMGIQLLTYREMSLEVPENWRENLLSIRNGHFSKGIIIDIAQEQQKLFTAAYKLNADKQTDYDKVNAYLLKVRKENWHNL